MRRFILTALVLALPACALAQQSTIRRPNPQGPPTPNPTDGSTLKAQWEIAGPVGPPGGPRPPFSSANAAGYTYKMYKYQDAAGVTLMGVTCTTTADPYVKTCQVTPVPAAFDVPGTSVDMTVTVEGIESVHSNTAIVPGAVVPPASTTNFRLLRTVLAFFRGAPPNAAKEPGPLFRFQVPERY